MRRLEGVGILALLCSCLFGNPPSVVEARKVTPFCWTDPDRAVIRCELPRRDTLFINVSFKNADSDDGETYVTYEEVTVNFGYCRSSQKVYKSTRANDPVFFHLAPHESPTRRQCRQKVTVFVKMCTLWDIAANTTRPAKCGDIFKVGVEECSRQYKACWKTGLPAILPSKW